MAIEQSHYAKNLVSKNLASKNVVFKDTHSERKLFAGRLLFSICLVIILSLVLLARYYVLQILRHEHFTTQSDANRIHAMAIPPARGVIQDLKGVVLAQSKPSFTLEIIKERVHDMDYTLRELQQLLQLESSEVDRFRERLQRKQRPYEGVLLRGNLDDEQIARIAVNRYRLPGVEVTAELVRDYPFRELFGHSIGYVGRISEKELKKIEDDGDIDDYYGVFSMGKVGIEKYYEKDLLGIPGAQNVETDVRGRILRTLDRKDPVRGKTLTLHLDVKMQQAAVDALAGRRGAVVAIELETGGVVTAVSNPSFDPNLFVAGISSKDYGALRDSPDLPLLNRMIAGEYPPGSTIKPHLALAGLDNGIITPEYEIYDPGFFQLPGQTHQFRDWKKGGHGGGINVHLAIAQSCDIFFYQLANRMGIDRMRDFLQPFGLGEPTGVDLSGERKGVLPSREWKRGRFKQAWYPGDTINAGIGQGYHLTTPMQLALATATLAKRGIRIRPHLVKAIDGVDVQPVFAPPILLHNPKHWDAVIGGMHEVAQGARGTARKVFHDAPYTVAGKTGTAQVVGIAQNEKYDAAKLSERQRDHGLFIAFAPVENPKIAIAVIVENGNSGSGAAAPVARKVLDAWLLGQTSTVAETPTTAETPAASATVAPPENGAGE
ncbi:MAG: penicillin-binding protein 2 [Pseudomonadales bacterium]|nr:penicillin-binding protein 2 [Pseudomonadales bacterium]